MIAADTSTWIAYLRGDEGDDTLQLLQALGEAQVVMPPVVISELLSSPKATETFVTAILDLPRLEILEGYWERAGRLRASVLSRGNKARLADTLIAVSCLDHRVPLITRDSDFRHFARNANLKLVPFDLSLTRMA